jgi:sugar phosphate permease
LLTAFAINAIGWRATFVVFSTLGVVWALIFYWLYCDDPRQHPSVNEAELALIAPNIPAATTDTMHPSIPWRLILANPNIWLLGTLQTCSSFLSYMFMGWYPAYLELGRGVSPLDSGKMASLVLFGAAIGCLGSGFINDFLARATNFHPIRFRLYGFTGTIVSAVALLISVQCESAWATSIWAAIAFMAAVSQQTTFWAVTTEIGGKHLGAVFGLMNSMGVPGAAVSSIFLGKFVEWMKSRGFEGRAQWDPAFYVYAAILVVGACCWLAVDARRSIADSADEQHG